MMNDKASMIFRCCNGSTLKINCQEERERLKSDSDEKATGYYEVQCDPDDETKYLSKQCLPDSKRCWCVDIYGETIPDSYTNPGETPIDCTTFGHCSSAKLKIFGSVKTPPEGTYVPVCDDDGNFAKSQNWESKGQSWCSSINGNKVPGTFTGPTKQALDCDNLPVCLEKAASEAYLLVDGVYPVDSYRPVCDGEGKFWPTQCNRTTLCCWCVNPDTGVEIAGTRQKEGEQGDPLDCHGFGKTYDEATATPCQKLRQEQLNNGPRPGAWVVRCEPDGAFYPSQCDGSTGHCWCVDETGAMIPGTETPPGTPRIVCHDPPTCEERRAGAERINRPGMHIPQCRADGTYKDLQHWGSTGSCFCVTRDRGIPINGTTRGPGEECVDCSHYQLPTCALERFIAEQSNFIFGRYIPQCNADGNWKLKQCRSGCCWCVTEYDGYKLPYTERCPSQNPGPDDLNCSYIETPTNLPPAELSAVRDNEEAEEGAKSVTGTTLGLVVVIVILVCVLIVVLIGSVVRFRRSRNSVPVQPPVSIEMN